MLFSLVRSYADEGMWLPMLLGQQVYKDMVKKGLKLSAEQLYSLNKASIKDAIIIFGGGCTGEIVSDQGLIFTNHHCGYSAIAAASTVEANYLRDGFWAADKSLEIPSKLSVKFLNRIEDVTAQIEAAAGNSQGTERAKKIAEATAALVKTTTGGNNFVAATVTPFFKGNQYLLFVYDVYQDIRLVGTPPEAIGKFGGDTDNWEWPRHTGDFSVFRVYAGADGKPAEYSKSNVPLKPKYFLPVSIKGISDGSYSMIFGYPGSTNRYESSFGIKLATDINNPTLVKLRDMRLRYMHEEMVKSPAVKLQLAGEYASVANYWKFYDGETKQLLKFKTYEAKQAAEQQFMAWAANQPAYANIFSDYAKAYAAWTPYAKLRVYTTEGILGCRLITAANSLQAVEAALKRNAPKEELDKALKAAEAAAKNYRDNYNLKADQRILANALAMFYADVDKSQQPQGFYEDLFKTYSSIDENPYRQFAAEVFAGTMLLDGGQWAAFKAAPSLEKLSADPAYKVVTAFVKNYTANYGPKYEAFAVQTADLGRLYLKGLMQQDPAKAKMMYPDANFTMRVSYGNVKSYNPRDAVHYDYVTTMKGVMEKYVPGDYEFDLPKKYVDLVNARDYGQYIDKKYNDVVVGFITTNDITGGNSGSPVINGNGELIGLAFDGNYEALSHKLAFDKDLNRTICVDVRYVLWCIDKLGGAPHIVQELKLVK